MQDKLRLVVLLNDAAKNGKTHSQTGELRKIVIFQDPLADETENLVKIVGTA